MKNIVAFLVYVFFLLFLTNNIFCMSEIKSPEIECPDFVFLPDTRSDTPINLDEINFTNIDRINFNFDFFKKIVSMYCCSKLSYLSNSGEWLNSEKRGFPFGTQYDEFSKRCRDLISRKFARECDLHDIFYAQKLFIDQTTKLITISDLHADFDSLVAIFNNMHNSGSIDDNLIIRDNNFLIGLGDYVDRKNMSLRTLAFLLIIALKNPGRVILLRGNHEDLNTNLSYRINIEIVSVFGEEFLEETYKLLVELYELMPSVLYVAQTKTQVSCNDFLIFSHALLDFKFDPSNLLDFNNSELMKNGGKCFCVIEQNIFETEEFPDVPWIGYGFIWHDIGLNISSRKFEIDPKSNRCRYRPEFIASFCKKYSSKGNTISGMVGGHDHRFAMRVDKGLYEKPSAVGYVKVFGKSDCAEVKTGLIGTQYPEGVYFENELELGDSICFSMVKFISAPMDGIACKPTYLVISRRVAMNRSYHGFWNYQVIEGP